MAEDTGEGRKSVVTNLKSGSSWAFFGIATRSDIGAASGIKQKEVMNVGQVRKIGMHQWPSSVSSRRVQCPVSSVQYPRVQDDLGSH
jgi:hypothetical protein